MGNTPNFEACTRRWTASGFTNEDSLEFILQGVDAVGNMALMISHQWRVGKYFTSRGPFSPVCAHTCNVSKRLMLVPVAIVPTPHSQRLQVLALDACSMVRDTALNFVPRGHIFSADRLLVTNTQTDGCRMVQNDRFS